jgi:hypothetical protein
MFAKHILVIFVTVIALVGNKCTSIALAKPSDSSVQISAVYQNSAVISN